MSSAWCRLPAAPRRSPSGARGTRRFWQCSSVPTMLRPPCSSPWGCASSTGWSTTRRLGWASRAAQLAAFDRDHRFCGRCGSITEPSPVEHARICTGCGATVYPRLSPAVIVLVERGDTCLLARSPRFPPGVYSAIAGFVEPGETAEHAVERELAEECGIAATDLRYAGSQPWPFPHSLMLGFTATYAGGRSGPTASRSRLRAGSMQPRSRRFRLPVRSRGD